ncbi:hypothetical protein C2G38_2221558 [Gigaspora rosea]|uniref:WD40-repeat-containing domain protein n=1 Tax=Gigaspora rosea TaxID=44941 RepID=A0A397U4Z3_9GLOM|nr:hypothetical protein C2G38_2221558 [Gigaspora rosea]
MSLLFSVYENKYIKLFDVNVISNACHLNLVIVLDIDLLEMILVSEGHNSFIRLWDIVSTRQCVQEFVSHWQKSDEGILCVEYYRSLLWITSSSADLVVKIYV